VVVEIRIVIVVVGGREIHKGEDSRGVRLYASHFGSN
jgi:hypothetical protein